MGFETKRDEIKRKRLISMSSNIWHEQLRVPGKKTSDVIIRITGGIGDFIMGLGFADAVGRYVDKRVVVASKFPDLGREFSSFAQIHENEIGDVDWYLFCGGVVRFYFAPNFEGFKSERITDLHGNFHNFLKQVGLENIVINHPHLDGYAADECIKMGISRWELSARMLGLSPRKVSRVKTNKISIGLSEYITVHDGVDNNARVDGRATKTWSLENWNEFCQKFRSKHPSIKIVQLGGAKSRIIEEADIKMTQNSISESFDILEGSMCHVDGDSGLVHAAHIMSVKSVVLFGPTPAEFFGYRENINIKPEICGNCFWSTNDWLNKCPIGLTTPACMDSIEPSTVLDAVGRILG